jgi:tetraacyldisaccharide 4'-kinase
MNRTTNWFQSLIAEKKEGKLRKIFLFPLCLLSFFYGALVRMRVWFFTQGIFRSYPLPCKVISVGNITLGGTGKTPLAAFLAEFIHGKGRRAAILSRGYKGEFSGLYGVVTDGEKTFMSARQAGDEPYLLSMKLKGIPIIIGKKRRISGQFAVERFKSQVIILDDGFQHLPLKRDLNLLLLDARAPFGNGYLFPRGVLREPLRQVKRADAIILTKTDQCDNIIELKGNLEKWAEGRPIFAMHYKAVGIRIFNGKDVFPITFLRHKKIWAFTGIGNPESFRKTLTNLESQILGFVSFPDHYWFKPEDIQKLLKEGEEKGADALITTEKDSVRLEGLAMGKIPLWMVCIKPDFIKDEQGKFEKFLSVKLGWE